MLQWKTMWVVYSAIHPSSSMFDPKYFLSFLTFVKRMFDSRRAVTAPDTQTTSRALRDTSLNPRRGCFHTCRTRLPLEERIKRRASLTPLHRATVAHRHFSVATGWPRFYGYGVPSACLPGQRWQKKKKKKTSTRWFYLITTNKGRCWWLIWEFVCCSFSL